MNRIDLFNCKISESKFEILRPIFMSGQTASGSLVQDFEREISKHFGGRPVVAVSNLTNALSLALRLAGVGSGDGVLTLSYNCLTSTAAISSIGATAQWIDIDPIAACISLDDVERSITAKTKALVVYHVAGYPADLTGLSQICESRGIILIEDANNAIGSVIGNVVVGTVGRYAVVSLYANRQINAVDGAILVCSDEESKNRACRLRRLGIDGLRFRGLDGEINPRMDIPDIGIASTLSEVNAALAIYDLGSLATRLQKTRHNVALLKNSLEDIDAIRPIVVPDKVIPAYWVWLVHCRQRDKVLSALKGMQIQCSKIHHPNHLYSGFDGSTRSLPGTKQFMESILALPCGWWLQDVDINRIANAVRLATR